MENASKALLIAGSILIVILLIAMGVRVFNSTSGTTDSVEGTMQSTEIAMFNNRIIQYTGKNKTRSEAISFCNFIDSINATSNRKIEIHLHDSLGTPDSYGIGGFAHHISRLAENIKLEIMIVPLEGAYDSNGFIKKVCIKKHGGT